MSGTQILQRSTSVGSVAGLIVGGVIGTIVAPLIGTIIGAALGSGCGAWLGLVNAVVLTSVQRRALGRGQVRFIAAATSAAVALGVVALSDNVWTASTIWITAGFPLLCAAIAAIVGPWAAFGWSSTRAPLSRGAGRLSRCSTCAAAVCGGLGALAGLVVGLQVYPATSLFGAAEIGIPAACLGYGVGAVADLVRAGHAG